MTTYLLTGATGTFGRAFVAYTLNHDPDSIIRCFSRDEFKQSQMAAEYKNDSRLRFLLGDVRDLQRLHRAAYGVDVIVHAAALKHVPLLEYNPREAVLTNVVGTMNVIEAAIDAGVRKSVFLSSDKAVHPINLYGATKATAEKLWIGAAVYAGARGDLSFSAVRYGNVLGSRGSVVEVWKNQVRMKMKPTVTDVNMTRFVITRIQAVELVHTILPEMLGGEIFVPHLPTVRMLTLLEAVVGDDVEYTVTGIRPGEKLHEELISEEEFARVRMMGGGYYVIQPQDKPVTASVIGSNPYSSDQSRTWLTVEQVQKYLRLEGLV